MKKKLLFGILAAVLVVLNALALSSFTAAAGGAKAPFPNLKYQTLANNCTTWGLQLACTNMYNAESCKIHCGQSKGSMFEFAFDNRLGDYYGEYQNAQWIK
ncbi:hypothetical protein SAMN06298214_0968 [Bacteroidales bacterium WCE2004]|nr:hypothetical protein [Bacteroidales bacterium]SKC50216.1 hypothetical protein SAMN06298214_0968 [Bacteroidales bacterium WCE2004]